MLPGMTLGKSRAYAHFEQIAWTDKNTIVYARFAGKPVFVKAMAGNLSQGKQIVIQREDRERHYYRGDAHCRILFHKIENVGIATYYNRDLFSTNASRSFIIGKDEAFIKDAFQAIVSQKPIMMHESWDMTKILTDMDLLTPIDSHGCKAYEAVWDNDKINDNIAELVRGKVLTF
ncbi:MAG: hypothetical protein WC291_00555 [Thermodesulfovibrionales bacterium]|jgi:hypothetical protein